MSNKVLTATSSFRFRQAPSIKGASLKTYVPGTYNVQIVDGDVTAADGYHWQKLTIEGVVGYVATEVVTISGPVVVPAPTTIPVDIGIFDDAKSYITEALGDLDMVKAKFNAALVKLQMATGEGS